RSNSNLNFRAQFASQSSSRRIPHSSLDPMANFAAQLKERFLGLVDRVTGCGRGAAAKEEATKPAMKEVRAYDSVPFPYLVLVVVCVYLAENSACVLFVAFAARGDPIESSQRVRRIRGGSQLAHTLHAC
uniref:Uncharacterized protein n=1 Tax=Aegilops tauschii subsp. strangulata TaxID=200361 RepID=A0A453DA01_AEGTS